MSLLEKFDALEATRQELLGHGTNPTDVIVERARREIELAKEAAVEEVFDLAGRLSTEVASKVIRKEVHREDHDRLIREAAEKIRAARAAN